MVPHLQGSHMSTSDRNDDLLAPAKGVILGLALGFAFWAVIGAAYFLFSH